MARNSRSTFRRGILETQRRKKAWIDMNALPAVGDDISGSALQPPDQTIIGEPTLSLLQFPSQAGFLESTILRIRGTLSVPKSTYAVSATTTVSAFGIGIVSDDAAEALAVPNPATATGYDWDGWLFLRQHSTISLDPAFEIVDVKSMRKWKSGDSIVFVAGFASNAGAVQMADLFIFSLRGLFLLP